MTTNNETAKPVQAKADELWKLTIRLGLVSKRLFQSVSKDSREQVQYGGFIAQHSNMLLCACIGMAELSFPRLDAKALARELHKDKTDRQSINNAKSQFVWINSSRPAVTSPRPDAVYFYHKALQAAEQSHALLRAANDKQDKLFEEAAALLATCSVAAGDLPSDYSLAIQNAGNAQVMSFVDHLLFLAKDIVEPKPAAEQEEQDDDYLSNWAEMQGILLDRARQIETTKEIEYKAGLVSVDEILDSISDRVIFSDSPLADSKKLYSLKLIELAHEITCKLVAD